MKPKSLFICYARRDREAANRLAAALRALDVKTFVDHDSTKLNTSWDEEIPRIMGEHQGVVVLLTSAWKPGPPSKVRPWYVRDEVQWAIDYHRRQNGRFLLIALHERGFDFDWVPYGLRHVTSREVDLRDPVRNGLLASQLDSLLSRAGAETGDPPPFRARLARLRVYWSRDDYLDPSLGRWRRLSEVYVDPPPLDTQVTGIDEQGKRRRVERGPHQLRALVDQASTLNPPADELNGAAPRWHLYGETGMGKSIRARWLVWLLAQGLATRPSPREGAEQTSAPIEGAAAVHPSRWFDIAGTGLQAGDTGETFGVVYLSGFDPDGDLLEQAERDAIARLGPVARGLTDELSEALREGDLKIVFVLDLDCPRPAHFDRLKAWADADLYRRATFIVCSPTVELPREVGDPAKLNAFGQAQVRSYPTAAQRQLAQRHLPPGVSGEGFLAKLRHSGLSDFASVPMVLRWLVEAFGEQPAVGDRWSSLPASLPELWARIHPVFIAARRHGATPATGNAARQTWGLLAYDLHASGTGRWTRRDLLRAVERLFRRAPQARFLELSWLLPEACLRDLLESDRVLIRASDGRYRFVSTWVRDHLVAEGIWSTGSREAGAFNGDHPIVESARGRQMLTRNWADAHFLASINFEHGLDVVTLNTELSGWDGDTLYSALREWMHAEELTEPAPAIEALLAWSEGARRRVDETRLLDCAGYVHYALTSFGHRPDASFFSMFGLPTPRPCSTESWVEIVIPKGEPTEGKSSEREFVTSLGSSAKEIGEFFKPESPWYVGEKEKWQRYLIDRERHRKVRLARSYRLGRHPVTLDEYRAFLPDHLRGRVDDDPTHPATHVNWWHARLYAGWRGGRLPTEVEWEFACRSGSTGAYFSPLDDMLKSAPDHERLRQHIVYGQKAPKPTGPTCKREPNGNGLYDMLGNVWEWTEDRFTWSTEAGAVHGAPSGEIARRPASPPADRVARGGSFQETLLWVRCAARTRAGPAQAYDISGLRLAADLIDGS